MPDIPVDNAAASTGRKQDISSWQELNIARRRTRERKIYSKRKAALIAYFSTDIPVEEISLRHHVSSELLAKLVQKSLAQHKDGQPWGFRALLFDRLTSERQEPSTPECAPTAQLDTSAGDNEITSPLFNEVDTPAEETKDPEKTIEENTAPEATPQEIPTQNLAPEEPAEITEETLPTSEQSEDTVEERTDENVGAARSAQQLIAPVAAIPDMQSMPPVPPTEDDPSMALVSPIEDDPPMVSVLTTSDDQSTLSVAVEPVTPVPALPITLLPSITIDPITPLPAVPIIVGPITPAPIEPASVPALAEKGHYQRTSKRALPVRRLVHKRTAREIREQRRRRHIHAFIAGAVVALLLFGSLIPLAAAFTAYNAYTNIRSVAYDGLNHLLSVKDLLNISKGDPLAALNVQKLQKARTEFNLAEGDFTQLQDLVNRPDVQSALQQFAPQYGSQLGMAQHLVQVGLDVSRMGSELSSVGLLGANILHGSPLASGSTKPLLTANDVANIEGAMIHALYYITDIQSQMSLVSLKDLPFSAKQKAQLTSALALLPKARDYIVQAQGLMGIVTWLLGVGQDRRFLVQTMDSAELRPSGGFTGQYGVLEIQDGRVAPFSLNDVNNIDYHGNGVELYRQAPPQYQAWMKFGNWGLRDSNLSGDYPTSAKLSMQVFQDEGGGPVDGDISFTPTLISDILTVTGPIVVAEYGETITAKNLEDRLHYYQQNFGAIAVQEQKTGISNPSARKAFTTLLGRLLLDRVRHLQVQQLMQVIKIATKDIQSHDLEIYFSNPDAEAWLVEHGYSGSIDTFSQHDGFDVVQANISISKASQYVHTTEQDSVTLDPQGGATHVLTITLDYQQTGPVYGYDTYADYIRVYAPASAIFQWGDGFDTGQALCIPTVNRTGTPTPTPSPSPSRWPSPSPSPGTGKGNNGTDPNCTKYKTDFPTNAHTSDRYCPSGNYDLGQRGFIFGKGAYYWPVDSLGAPTALTSDIPGRAMWGGLTETPKNCTSTITLSWYVPHVVKNVPGQAPYALLVQKQGGYIPTVEISIDTSADPIKGLKPLDFSGDLTADRLFSLAPLKKPTK